MQSDGLFPLFGPCVISVPFTSMLSTTERVALLIALLQTPHRFRTKRQLWAYCGLALQTRSSGEYRYPGGQLQHSKRPAAIRDQELGTLKCSEASATPAGSACAACTRTLVNFRVDLFVWVPDRFGFLPC